MGALKYTLDLDQKFNHRIKFPMTCALTLMLATQRLEPEQKLPRHLVRYRYWYLVKSEVQFLSKKSAVINFALTTLSPPGRVENDKHAFERQKPSFFNSCQAKGN